MFEWDLFMCRFKLLVPQKVAPHSLHFLSLILSWTDLMCWLKFCEYAVLYGHLPHWKVLIFSCTEFVCCFKCVVFTVFKGHFAQWWKLFPDLLDLFTIFTPLMLESNLHKMTTLTAGIVHFRLGMKHDVIFLNTFWERGKLETVGWKNEEEGGGGQKLVTRRWDHRNERRRLSVFNLIE